MSLINEDNGFHIIPFNKALGRKLYENNNVDKHLNFSVSLENVNDLANSTKKEIEPKLQEILTNNDNNFNLLKKYESIFSGLYNDEVYKTYELYLSDEKNIKGTYNNLKDIKYNKKIKELNDETLDKKELRYIWINIKSNEENKYFYMITKIYKMLMHMKIKYKEDNIFTNDLWKDCYSNYLSEKKNVEHLLKEMFDDWLVHGHIKLDEFKIVVLGTKLIYRQLLNNIKKENKEIIINAFKGKLQEKKLRNSKIAQMYKMDFEKKNEKKKNKFLNYYLKKKNHYPEMNDKIFIKDNKHMSDVNYYLEENTNEIKHIDSDVDDAETEWYDTKLLLDEKKKEEETKKEEGIKKEEDVKKEEDIIKENDGKVGIQYDEDDVADTEEDGVKKPKEYNANEFIEKYENVKVHKKKKKKHVKEEEVNVSDDESMATYFDDTSSYSDISSLNSEDSSSKEKNIETYSSKKEELLDAGETQGDKSVPKVTDVKDDDSLLEDQYSFGNKPIVYEEESDAGETRMKFSYGKQHRKQKKKKKNFRRTLV